MLFYSLLATLEPEERSRVEKIFYEYGELIYNVSYGVLHNREDAEDNVNNVMINVIKNVDRFMTDNRNIIWPQLVIYSRNSAINIYNKNKRRNQLFQSYTYETEDGELADIDLIDESRSVEELILSKETVEILEKYIKMLNQDYQDVIKLIYGYGYTNIEVANAMNITPNAVALKLHRAKKRLLELAKGELHDRVI